MLNIDKIRDELEGFSDLKTKLDRLAEIVSEQFGVDFYFCEVIGKRWSFFAGREDVYMPLTRIEITEKYGIIIDDTNISKTTISDIVIMIKKIMQNITS